MKKSFLLGILFTALIVFSCGQEEFKEKFSFSPEKPKPGDEITVKYNPSGTKLENAGQIELITYLYSNGLDDTRGVEMEKKGNGWIAKFKTDQSDYGVLIKFKNDDVIDNNENKAYQIFLYQDDGSLIPGAIAGVASANASWGYYLDIDLDRDYALQTFEKEFAANPDIKPLFLNDYLSVVNRLKQDQSNAIIAGELANLEAKENLSEDEIVCLANWYNRINEKEKYDAYSAQIQKEYPKSEFVQQQKYYEFRNETDINKKIEFAKNFETDFPESEYTPYLYDQICSEYANSKQFGELKNFLINNPDKPSLYRYYSIVTKMLDENEDAGTALEIAKLGVDRGEKEINNPSGKKPKTSTESEWIKNIKYYYGLNLYAFGNAQYKLGHAEDAVAPLAKAIEMTDKEEADANELYSRVLLDSKQYEKAMTEIETFIKDGKSNSSMKDILKQAYIKTKGSDSGFDEYLAKFESAAKDKMLEDLKNEMLDMPAPQFTLSDLEGNQVSLSDLKGKNVIIDFWATWCGPCKASFPGMKLTVEKFTGNENVEFLFVNSWERVDDKKKNAADFISANDYPFQVLLDEDNKVITDFKVSGIPTKFIIDKNGNIRFKSIGFDGNTDQLVEEISAMISLLN